MKYNKFANSDKDVSQLCYGAMGLNFAFGSFDERDLLNSMHSCFEQGINMIDTARLYGGSERIVGKFLKEYRGNRPFVATKAAAAETADNIGWAIPNPIEVAYPKGRVTAQVEQSLQELDVDTIDLLQLHQYWSVYENGDWLDELAALKKQGKVQHIGVSVIDHRPDQALGIVKSGLIDSVQTIINIFDPLAFDTLVPLAQANDVAIIARCVLDEGGLTGVIQSDTIFENGDFRKGYFDHGPRPEYIKRVDELKRYIPEYADSIAELALRYVLSHPGVTTATVSMHIPEFASANIAAANKGPLPDPLFQHIRRYHRWLHSLYQPKYFPDADRTF